MNNARQLRKNQTDAEKLLWHHLRGRQVRNKKFRRQHQIGSYIVDLVCWERKLIVEVDGGQHSKQTEYDERRAVYLQASGFRVLRFWNNEVLTQTDAVLQLIYEALSSPHPNPLPEGEGMP